MFDEFEIRSFIKKVYNRYVCLQREDFYIEYDENKNIIVLRWPVCKDRWINMKDVFKVAKYIRKTLTEIPIYSSFGLLNI